MDWLTNNWITIVVVVVIAFVLWSTLGRKARKAPGESIQLNMKCPKCGWSGIVSKYAVACRKCANKDMQPM